MAIAARRSISLSSLRRWAVASMDLTMAPPPFLIASHRKQILGNHTPAHVALKSELSFIGGSLHGEGMLQGADGGFTAGPPAQRSPEPALLLLLRSRGRESPAGRQRHLFYPKSMRLLLVCGRKETAVAGGHRRCLPEARLMLLEGRHPGRRIGRIARENLVAAYDAVFHLVNAHQPTKLVGLMRFPFANDFGVRFEQTQHLTLHVAVAAQHSFLGLADHLFDQGRKCRSWPICVSTRSHLPTTFSRLFLHRCITALACRTTPRVRANNFW